MKHLLLLLSISALFFTQQLMAQKPMHVTTTDSISMNQTHQPDVLRAMKNMFPGVSISGFSDVSGSGTEIVIRGYSTFSGSNDPLFFVDGVRFHAGNNASNFFDGGGRHVTPTRIMDLDPQQIANISVLRGLSATAIYGEEGRNGVVLITTNALSGSPQTRTSSVQASFTQSLYQSRITSVPEYQTTHGLGFDQHFGWFFSNWGPRYDSTDPSRFGTHFRGFDSDGTVIIAHPTIQNAAAREAYPELILARIIHK